MPSARASSVLHFLLEVAVGAAARHGADGAHAAVGLVGAALVKVGLVAGGFVGACKQRSRSSRTRRPPPELSRDRPENLMPPSAITGTSCIPRHFHRVHDGRELRTPTPGHDARGADGARADAHLHRIRAGIDESLRAVAGGERLPRSPARGSTALDARHHLEHAARMAMGAVSTTTNRRRHRSSVRRARSRRCRRCGRSHPQAALVVLAGVGILVGLLDVLTVMSPMQR